MLLLEGKQRSYKADRDEVYAPTKPEIDAELAKMRSMTPEQAAAVAARAVAEAEIAMAEAEEAAREAEAAEADAEAAQAFAEAAMKTLKGRSSNPRVVRSYITPFKFLLSCIRFDLLILIRNYRICR